jgi:OmcA/MtrC family decaheme c-type cytochrome
MIHKIHRGADLPSVKAGKPYKVYTLDYSNVRFPAGVNNCEVCHDPNSGAAQADAWLKPSREACGSCHDKVNFATGEGHLNLPQLSDNQCASCHIPKGELEFDASIRGAHLDARFSRDLPGVVFAITNVEDTAPGSKPKVTFTLKDNAGAPLEASKMDYLTLVLAGPTSDYKGMVTEDARKAAGSGGTYTHTFQASIPADAKGSFAVSIEGYRYIKLLPGTKKERTVRNVGENQIAYFSVDGSKAEPRRTVVKIENCNACHLKLEMHAGIRTKIEHCVLCHNPNQTDGARRTANQMPAETVTFKTMIHRIHTGEDLKTEYTLYGYGGIAKDEREKLYPGDRRNCGKCHVNGSEQLPLPEGLLDVVNPRGKVNPMGPVAAACMGCHTSTALASHVNAMTTPLGESCEVCHGKNAEFSVNRAHAR